MISIYPFQALMPNAATAGKVAAAPYDVVNREEAAELADGNPLSFLRISRPDIEFSADTDPYSDAVYERAVQNFNRISADAPLTTDATASIYVYSMLMNGRRQTGIAATIAVDDYDADRIKKHELTRKAKEDDRTRHILELRSHTGPVFLAQKSNSDIDGVVAEIMTEASILKVNADDGVCHEIWRASSQHAEQLIALFRDVSSLYVADGHHRAKSASRTRETCRTNNPDHTGDERYNRFMAVIFPADQLLILPYNRVVKDLNGLSEDDFLNAVRREFTVSESTDSAPDRKGIVNLYLNRKWYRLERKNDVESGASFTDSLDVSVLQQRLLQPILGINDPRTDGRIDFVGGCNGVGKMQAMVEAGRAAVAFSLSPVTIDDLMTVSDQGLIMPPKSTWFEPKLLDGLLCHCF